MNLKAMIMEALSDHLGREATEEEFRRLAPLMDVSAGHRTMDEVFQAYDALTDHDLHRQMYEAVAGVVKSVKED